LVRVVGGIAAMMLLVAKAARLVAGFEAQLGGHVFECALNIFNALFEDALLSRPVEQFIYAVGELHRREGCARHVDLDTEIEAGEFRDGAWGLRDDVRRKDVLVVNREGKRGVGV
jgi:hypothetical protein